MDKQFEILGERMKFADIPESGIVTYKEGKKEKKDYWYNVYKLTEEEEAKWHDYMLTELEKFCADDVHLERVFQHLDLCYGFVRRYKKEGELF